MALTIHLTRNTGFVLATILRYMHQIAKIKAVSSIQQCYFASPNLIARGLHYEETWPSVSTSTLVQCMKAASMLVKAVQENPST